MPTSASSGSSSESFATSSFVLIVAVWRCSGMKNQKVNKTVNNEVAISRTLIVCTSVHRVDLGPESSFIGGVVGFILCRTTPYGPHIPRLIIGAYQPLSLIANITIHGHRLARRIQR